MMKAAFYRGDRVLDIGDMTPTEPGEGEVQIEIAFCGVCGTDLHIYLGHMDQRVAKPLVPGHETSGRVVALGAGVTEWAVGDRVTVRPLDPCHDCPACAAGHAHICANLKFLGIDSPGAMQSRWTVPAHTLHRLPDSVSLERGALIEPLAVAVHDVRLGQVQEGEFVVVQGGGPIGLLVALVAKRAGGRVVVTELNPHRIALARKLGLEAIDPSSEDVVRWVNDQTGGAGADVVFEVSGSAAGAALMTQLPRTRGRIVVVAIFAQPPAVDLFRFFWRELRLCGARVYEPRDFEQAIAIAATDDLPLDLLISQKVPLSRAGEVFEDLARGGDQMKVLVECSA